MEVSTGNRNDQAAWLETAGRDGAPAVILIHGSVVNRSSWRPQVQALAQNYRVIVPDLPGHGALIGEAFHFERAAELVDELVNRLAGGRAALVGASLGGHIATLYASRCPEKVSALVLNGASMNFQGMLGWYVRGAAYMMMYLMRPAALERHALNNMEKKWPAEIVHLQREGGIAPLGAAQSFAEIWRYDFRSLLASIPAPVLIQNGEIDRANRRSEAVFAAAAAHARIAIVPGAGHACNIENPAAYNQILLSFLDEVLKPM
jgi:pimeloyl-ACP methyl ester carboxylesterase